MSGSLRWGGGQDTQALARSRSCSHVTVVELDKVVGGH